MNEEEQTEEKRGLEKIMEIVGKNRMILFLGIVIVLLTTSVFVINIATQKKRIAASPHKPTPSLLPTPQPSLTPTPQNSMSELQREILKLKEQVDKINLADPNLAFPALDFSITLQSK